MKIWTEIKRVTKKPNFQQMSILQLKALAYQHLGQELIKDYADFADSAQFYSLDDMPTEAINAFPHLSNAPIKTRYAFCTAAWFDYNYEYRIRQIATSKSIPYFVLLKSLLLAELDLEEEYED
ncbi:hypothetical protein [Chroococcus sp. FPU101]|uniref:hypothetical protein n=1 Tax=Chroococcus sp. FPU101 TaxID=1974212 RepID=UPI001A8D77F6|nr:hypothetical protein [Chroococcus sp. FPU101]GFE71943.1 hypothetical protein CFPU101_45530 [Chroococcus sp. FPU101]